MKTQLKQEDSFHSVVQTADRCGPLGWDALREPKKVELMDSQASVTCLWQGTLPASACLSLCTTPWIRGKIQSVLNINSENKLI